MAEPIIVSGGKKSDNRRVKIMGAVGAAIFLLLVVLPKVLGGGGGGAGDVTEFPPVVAPPAAPAQGAAVPETFEGFTSKNPFKPLVAMASASGGGDVTTVDTGGGPVIPPGDFVDTPATIPGEDGQPVVVPTDPGATSTTVPPRQPDRVGLLEVYTDQGGQPVTSVRVNDTTYQVVRGDRFAGSYQVISIDVASRCGDFLFGDDRFRLCEGDEVRK